jgi:FlaA1/EpsC-like NDP-sugar epimerase
MKTILITGGNGFLGRHLALKLKADYRIVLAGRNNFFNNYAKTLTSCESVPLDITNIDAVREVFEIYRPDIVIHAAATKYVDLAELFPNECIDINIKGSQNIARTALDKHTKLVIGISTDKASPPSPGIYAKSKSIMEKLFLSMNDKSLTNFFCLRFGNIAWSTGSVFPLWTEMVNTTGVIESTGSHMRRFMFSVDEACQMVVDAIDHAELLHGKILAKKMKAVHMSDVLEVFTAIHQVSYKKIDARIGETVDEIMVGETEVHFTVEKSIHGRNYYLIDYTKKVGVCIDSKIDTNTSEKLNRKEIADLITLKNESLI